MSPLEHSSSLFLALNFKGIGEALAKVFDFEEISTSISLIPISIGIIILVICSAYFSASETAFSTLNIMRIRTYAQDKKRGARKALWIAENYEKTVTAILIGNNFVNITATTLATMAFAIVFIDPTVGNIANTIVMTLIVLCFGEIIPKCTAKANAEKFAILTSGLLYFIIKVLTPLVFIFLKFQKIFVRKKEDDEPTVTEQELESIIDTMEEEGVIDKDDASLIQSVLDIGDRTVNDIMIPRVDFIAVENTDSVEEIKKIFLEYKFSRLPVYKEDKDHIIGVLSDKDFFAALFETPNRVNIKKLIKTPLYVSETMKVDDLIRKMQKAKKHLAIVSDEYGGTSGIVTMEDALEELVGEIYDEHDDTEVENDIEKISDTSYKIVADVMLDDLYETLNLGEAPDTNYPTLGGYLYGMFEHIPVVGDTFTADATIFTDTDSDTLLEERYFTLQYTILKVVERRIISVQLDIFEKDNNANTTSEEDDKDKEKDKDE